MAARQLAESNARSRLNRLVDSQRACASDGNAASTNSLVAGQVPLSRSLQASRDPIQVSSSVVSA